MRDCRGHRFGGTTYKYGGHSGLLARRDFDPVPGVPLASWPVTYDELAPWLAAAIVRLGHREEDFDLARRLDAAGLPVEDGRASPFAGLAVFARDRDDEKPFPLRFAADLHRARDLDVLLHAVVTRVVLDENATGVARLEVGTQAGTRLSVSAQAYVLACHAVENARLLLDHDVVTGGIGNRSGLLGRCFADHPHLDAGTVHFGGDVPWHLVYPRMAEHGFAAALTVPQAVTDGAGCLQHFCRLLPLGHGTSAEAALAALTASRHPTGRAVRRAAGHARRDPVAAFHAARRLGGSSPRTFTLNHRIEQAPNPSSRVVLADERDALGRRRAAVDWHLDDIDLRTLEVGQASALRALERLGATRVRPARVDPPFVASRGATYWHHIGTTRMASAPADGVVDEHCRVHGVRNLYVAGSSVFCRPTLAPPTMTIVAFALRLADHLGARLVPAARATARRVGC